MMRLFRTRGFWCLVGILLVGALILWPLARPGFIVTDDGDWMVIRLSAFFQSLREGQFPVRFLGRLNHGYGYPVANFLYPGFLYIGSFIHAFGVSFPNTIKLIFAGSTIASTFFIFAWLRKQFSAFSSFIGSLNFIFAPYLFFDIYKRGSVGEILALVPVSAAFYSIDSKRPWLLPWAIGLLIISHNSLALMFLIVLAVYIFMKGNTQLFLHYTLGIGLGTFFWFPALFERRLVIFDQVSISEPARYFIEGAQIVMLGLSSIAAVCLLLLTRIKQRRLQFIFFVTLFIFSIFLATSPSSVLWHNKLFSDLFQFPFRFLAIGLLTGSWLVADTLTIFAKHTAKLLALFIILWLIPLFSLLTIIKTVERPLSYYTTNEATTTVRDEYLPRWVTVKPLTQASQKIVFYKGHGKLNLKTGSSQHLEAVAFAEEDSVIQINTIYYPGWGVTIDGQLSSVNYQNPLGVMRVLLPQGKHRLVAEFRETVPRFVADMVSLGCAVLAITYALYRARSKLST